MTCATIARCTYIDAAQLARVTNPQEATQAICNSPLLKPRPNAVVQAHVDGFPFLEWHLNEGVAERRLRLSNEAVSGRGHDLPFDLDLRHRDLELPPGPAWRMNRRSDGYR